MPVEVRIGAESEKDSLLVRELVHSLPLTALILHAGFMQWFRGDIKC